MILRSLLGTAEESDLTNPENWLLNMFNGATTTSGERVTGNNALLNSNVFTCASILGGDIGKLPLQVFRKTKNKIERENDHPVAYLLGTRPNPYMSAYTFKELLEVHMVVWGNAYCNIEWGWNGKPKALWVLDPSKIDVLVDHKTGELWYVTSLPSGEQRKIPFHDIVHLKGISRNGLKGITPISVIREQIGIQQMSTKFLGAFYANGTATKGVLTVPSKLEKDAKDKLREEWTKLNSGLSNAHRIAILDSGLDYKNLGMPLEDAQFIETQKFGISEVAKIYKVPPHKLGQLDRATFSNIEQQSLDYVKTTLQPIAINWEQEFQFKLFIQAESKKYYLRFNMSSELRGDSQSRAQYYKEMIAMGVYNINEVRALEEQDSIGELGDKHLVSLFEISPTPFPAYLDSEVSKRSINELGINTKEQRKLEKEKLLLELDLLSI
ncbi:phage portal protein [Brevibacillus laterosporus]|uniref:phage portal protein n=1 Tax=Brevibacillus laterosporus TaxID=1465 RepID=UPI003D23E4E7